MDLWLKNSAAFYKNIQAINATIRNSQSVTVYTFSRASFKNIVPYLLKNSFYLHRTLESVFPMATSSSESSSSVFRPILKFFKIHLDDWNLRKIDTVNDVRWRMFIWLRLNLFGIFNLGKLIRFNFHFYSSKTFLIRNQWIFDRFKKQAFSTIILVDKITWRNVFYNKIPRIIYKRIIETQK